MVEKQWEQGYKRCPECFEIVGLQVKICPTCRSFQDWRRYVALGQTNFALLVALASILTTLITVALPFYSARGSDIRLLLERTSMDGELVILARNDGRSGGVAHLFQLTIGYDMRDYFVMNVQHQGTYVEAGKEQRIIAKYDNLAGFCMWLRKNAGNIFSQRLSPLLTAEGTQFIDKHRCTMNGFQISFYKPSSRDIDTDFRCFAMYVPCMQMAP